jgi:hypothetical protein
MAILLFVLIAAEQPQTTKPEPQTNSTGSNLNACFIRGPKGGGQEARSNHREHRGKTNYCYKLLTRKFFSVFSVPLWFRLLLRRYRHNSQNLCKMPDFRNPHKASA